MTDEKTDEKDLLAEEAAIAFAGVTESTLHRYIDAGFLHPESIDGVRFFKEVELTQVFELSPKRAAANRRALQKKELSEAERLMSEKDRLMADKDIQIRDLKDQRAWLQARVERLESDFQNQNSHINNPVEVPKSSEFITPGVETTLPTTLPFVTILPQATAIITPPIKTAIEAKGGALQKVLQYFGFVKNVSDSRYMPKNVDLEVDNVETHITDTTIPELQNSADTFNTQTILGDTTTSKTLPPKIEATKESKPRTRGNRPFRESKQTVAELLGEEGFLTRDISPRAPEGTTHNSQVLKIKPPLKQNAGNDDT